MSRYTSATDADRREMLDAIGVESIDELFDAVPEGVRLGRAARPPAREAGAGGLRAPARSGRPQRQHRGRDQLPRRRDVRPLRPEPDRLDPVPLRVPDALHALPAGDLPGRAAGDVRVPDRDQRADRPAGLQRERVRGAVRARRRRLPGEAAQQAHALPDLRGRPPARTRDAGDDRRRLGHDRRGDPARGRRHADPRARRRRLRRARAVPELPRRRRGPPGPHRRRPRGRRADDRR